MPEGNLKLIELAAVLIGNAVHEDAAGYVCSYCGFDVDDTVHSELIMRFIEHCMYDHSGRADILMVKTTRLMEGWKAADLLGLEPLTEADANAAAADRKAHA